MTADELCELLGIGGGDGALAIRAVTCCATQDKMLKKTQMGEGMRWLLGSINLDMDELNKRVEKETVSLLRQLLPLHARACTARTARPVQMIRRTRLGCSAGTWPAPQPRCARVPAVQRGVVSCGWVVCIDFCLLLAICVAAGMVWVAGRRKPCGKGAPEENQKGHAAAQRGRESCC